jgi:hypothetical protein
MKPISSFFSVRALGSARRRAALLAGVALLAGPGCVEQAGGGSGGNSAAGGDPGGAAGSGGTGGSSAGELHLSILEDQWVSLEGIPTPPPLTTTTACGFVLPLPVPSETVLATSGLCSLVTVDALPAVPWALNVGPVKVLIPSQGGYWLPAPSDAGDCSSHSSEERVLWNDVVTFEGQGDGGVPAFSVQVPAPPHVIAHVNPYFVAGEPCEVEFNEGDAPVRIELWGAGPEKIVCLASDLDPLVIDGSLTAEIEPINGRAVVSVTNVSEVTGTAGSIPLRARVVHMETFAPHVLP